LSAVRAHPARTEERGGQRPPLNIRLKLPVGLQHFDICLNSYPLLPQAVPYRFQFFLM